MTEISIFFEIVRLGDFTRKYKIFSDVTIPQNGSDVVYLTRSETVTQFSVLFLLKNTPDLNRYQENRYLGRICIFFRHIQPSIQPTNLRISWKTLEKSFPTSFWWIWSKPHHVSSYFVILLRFHGTGTIFQHFMVLSRRRLFNSYP